MRIIEDLHTHTYYSHGKNGPRDNVLRALELGLEAVAVSEHAGGNMYYGVRGKKLERLNAELAELRREFDGRIRVLRGLECNVMNFGESDIPKDRSEYDVIILGYHKGIPPVNRFARHILFESFGGKSTPRRNTESLMAAAEKGHTVTRFDAAFLKIGGCHACETCFKTGKACSFDDDFNTIAPAILDADVIVFTMPVYWYSIPAQIKGVIDRIYSLVVGGKDIAGKECALIACCEEDDLSVLDGVRIPMERTAALNKWKMVGEVLIPGVLNAGDIAKTDGCRQAAALADKI